MRLRAEPVPKRPPVATCLLALARAPSYIWNAMLHYAVTFLVIALVAAFLGFSGLAGTAAWIAKVCFLVFLVLAIRSFLTRSK